MVGGVLVRRLVGKFFRVWLAVPTHTGVCVLSLEKVRLSRRTYAPARALNSRRRRCRIGSV
ncbi:hypothetical protein GAN18_13610 [Mycobacterium kubicae]|nr:hypothetical protein GAN18_13610 [Mycobacterium kubicae]